MLVVEKMIFNGGKCANRVLIRETMNKYGGVIRCAQKLQYCCYNVIVGIDVVGIHVVYYYARYCTFRPDQLETQG